MAEEGTEEFNFDHAEAQDYKRDVIQSIHGTDEENIIEGSNNKCNLPVLTSVQMTNTME